MKRPVSIIVFGLLNIGWSMAMGAAVFGAIALATHPTVKQFTPMASWFKIWIPLGLLIGLLLVASGVGLLMVKRWGRTTALACAALHIIVSMAALLVQITSIAPALFRGAADMGSEAGALFATLFFGILFALFGLSYSVLLLVFMLRPNVTEAFPAVPQPYLPRRV